MKTRNIINYVLYTIIQLTWGILQNVCGILIFIVLSIVNIKRKRFYYHGAIVSEWKYPFSMGCGMFIFFGHKDCSEEYKSEVLVHEYGHTIQSIILGPLFMFVIAIPSLLWAFLPCTQKIWRSEGHSYMDLYCESWANSCGEHVLKMKAPSEASSK